MDRLRNLAVFPLDKMGIYQHASTEEDQPDKRSLESEEHLLPKESTTRSRGHADSNSPNRLNTIILVAGVLIWGILNFALGTLVTSRRHGAFGSFEDGFIEETVVTPPDMFELTQYTFTGTIEFNSDGDEVLAPSDYVGEPSPEIDAAWNTLIGGEGHYFSISEEEAKELWSDHYDKYIDYAHGGWTGTLDVFHCLHCLNQLRKALRRDIYPEEKHRGMIHQYHCIDHLRQVLMCQATSVISPSQWHYKRGPYINPKQEHTCRNFEKLHDFSKARYNGSIAVPRAPRIRPPPSLLPPEATHHD